MASKIKVDEITTTGESGNIVIPGGVGLDGSAATSYWAIPAGNTSQRVAAPIGAIRYSTETDSEGLEAYVADSDGSGNPGWVLLTQYSSGPNGTASNPFQYVSQADGQADGMYYVKVSSSTTKELYFKNHGSRMYALAAQRDTGSNFNAGFSNAGNGTPGAPESTSDWIIPAAELNYMTSTTNNPDAWGLTLVANYNNGYTDGNLVRSKGGSRAYPSNGHNVTNGGDMAKFNITTSSYPSSWNTSLNNNTYCSGTQVWTDFTGGSGTSWGFRWNTAGGCTYFNEAHNGVPSGNPSGYYISGWVR
jgi:hypothetical protein